MAASSNERPGTTTSDSIPIWASDHEYIVNARAAQSPGVMPLLEAINKGSRVGGLASLRSTPPAAWWARSGLEVARQEGRAAPPPAVLRIHPDAFHMTLRDWFERGDRRPGGEAMSLTAYPLASCLLDLTGALVVLAGPPRSRRYLGARRIRNADAGLKRNGCARPRGREVCSPARRATS